MENRQGFSELQRTVVGISQQQETLKREVTQNPSEVFVIKLYSHSNLTLKKYLVGEVYAIVQTVLS